MIRTFKLHFSHTLFKWGLIIFDYKLIWAVLIHTSFDDHDFQGHIQGHSSIQAWELSVKMQISAAVQLTFRGEKKMCAGKGNWGVQKKQKRSTDFSSATNTC